MQLNYFLSFSKFISKQVYPIHVLGVISVTLYNCFVRGNQPAQVDRAPAQCLGCNSFESCRGLRFFLCPMLVTCWSFHFHRSRIVMLKFVLLLHNYFWGRLSFLTRTWYCRVFTNYFRRSSSLSKTFTYLVSIEYCT